MTVRELAKRLSTLPADAHVTGFIDPGDGGERKIGVLIIWEVDDHLRTEFIETPILPKNLNPAAPRRST